MFDLADIQAESGCDPTKPGESPFKDYCGRLVALELPAGRYEIYWFRTETGNVYFAPTNHAFADPTRPIRSQGFQPSKGGIRIGDDVWIGANTVLLDGASIGDGCVIGAASLVRGELPAFCLVTEVLAPGLLVVKHSRGDETEKFVNVAVLQGDDVRLGGAQPAQADRAHSEPVFGDRRQQRDGAAEQDREEVEGDGAEQDRDDEPGTSIH